MNWEKSNRQLQHTRLVGQDQPFYGVIPSGSDGTPLLPTVEAMAEENIKQLIALQPQGPYLLGGYCNGGLIAYEMACQMEQQGLDVGLVILVDAGIPPEFNWLKALTRYGSGLAGIETGEQTGVLGRLRRYLIIARGAYREGGLGKVLKLGLRKTRNDLSSLLGTPRQDPEQRRREVQFQCNVLNYRPTPYPGRVVLLRTKSPQRNSSKDCTAGWGKLASDMEVHELPGNHATLKTEHVGAVAEHIGRCLSAYHANAQKALA